MHAPAPDHLTCLSCGYDLRAAGADEKCPECGFPVRESIIGHARTTGQWVWKVRLGIVLMLVAVPPLTVSLLTYTEFSGVGRPLTPLNFAGPKVWGVPLVRMSNTDEAVIVLIGLIVNTAGVYVVTAPPPPRRRERALSLRRCLRVHAVASVACLWVFIVPWFDWPRLPQGVEYHPFTTVLMIEVPGTIMLYFYLAEVAAMQLRDPPLVRRASHLLKGALVLQALSLVALSHGVTLPGPIEEMLLLPYGGATIGLGLWALDFHLDLYRALGQQRLE
jgi:hypothetical protein